MISQRYAQEYKVEYHPSPGGRIRTQALYIGPDYVFSEPEAAVRRFGRRVLLAAAAGWCVWLLPLAFASAAARTLYVAPLYAFFALPLGFLSAAAAGMGRAGGVLTHRQADRISHRFPAAALWMLLLSGGAAAGLALRAVLGFRELLWPGDLLFALCALLLTGLSAVLFRLRPMARTEKAPAKKG